MNIFVTSPSSFKSAYWLDDKRVIKMILESAQMLSSAARSVDPDVEGLYKTTHINHPCSIWARETQDNFEWLYLHAISLCSIYEDFSGKKHKSLEIIDKACRALPLFPHKYLMPFANCTEFKEMQVYEAYQNQMIQKWNNDPLPKYDEKKQKWRKGFVPKWTNRQIPEWAVDKLTFM